MANVIKLKQGSGSNPQASDLVLGELAIRTDGTPKLFALNDAGNVVGLGGAPDDGSITSAKIADGAIVNADINASAAIAGSKISPNFGSSTITGGNLNLSSTYPSLTLEDTNNNSDYRITNNDGQLIIYDITNSAHRLNVNADGHVDILGNLDVGAGIDVTGNIETTGMLKITSTAPHIDFIDTNGAPDFRLVVDSNYFQIYDINNAETRFKINTDGHVDIAGNLDCAAGIDVTGTVNVTSGDLNINSGFPRIKLNDTNHNSDFSIYNANGFFRIFDDTNSASRFHIASDGTVVIAQNLDVAAGVDVTGNITVTGTVDGVDIAARNTLFGGLTSSSGVLTNGVTATTQSAGDNSTKVATTAYTDTAIANLADSAPSTLNTLNELAAALGDDANFSTTVTNSIATKLALAGGTLTGGLIGTTAVFSSTSSAPALEAKGDGSSQDGYIQLNCSQNSHGIKLASPAHSAGASYTFTFPSSIVNNGVLKTDGSANTSFGLIATANVSDNAITLAKMQNVITDTILGRTTSGTGDIEVLSAASVRGIINVEDGATADQTASEILTLIKTVDGQGSGLDADFFDGLGSGSFLRSDADDTTSGHLTFSDSGYSIGNEFHVWKRDYVVNSSNPQELLYEDGNSLPNGGSYRFTAHISGTGTDQSARAVYWNQNGTWKLNVTYQSGTSSNHPEFILNNGVPTISTDHSSDYTISVLGERIELGEATGTDNRGGFGADGYFSSTPSDLRYNRDGDGAIGSGYLVWHAGNDGASSGLNADLLDGQHGSYYLDYSNFTNTPTVPTNNNQLTNGAGYITSAALAGASDGGNAALLDGIDSTQFLRSDADDTTSGTLGITSNSSFPLTIDGNADGKILLKGSNNPYIQFQENSTSKAYIQWHSSGHIKVHNTESGEELRIGSGNNGLQYEVDGSVKTVYHTGNLPTIPTNNNQLTNGAGYITSASFSDVAGGGTFTGDVSFSGGANAVSIAANSDIRLAQGDWTGESSSNYKIQAHSGALYLQAPAFIFRDDGGSNRWAITSSGHLVPSSTNTYDLGASGNRIQNLYVNDMHFSNEGKTNDVDGSWGDWTLQEGEEDIFMINNRSGKKFKIAMIPV